MKLSQLQEAKLAGTKISYVEMVDDGFGSGTLRKYVTTTAEMEQIHQAFAKKKRTKGEEDFIDNSSLGNALGLYEPFEYKWKEMKKAIQKTGSWSTEFDDGGIGISAKGPKHAAQLAKEEFMKAFAGEDDEDEDWY